MKRALLALILLATSALAQEAPRPNVLFLLSDDQRADAIGALGNAEIRTPNLDRLAAEGLAFERAYCMGATQGAVCVPSRQMILSGRSLFRLREPEGAPFELLPERFRAAGYATFFTGKWHAGRAWFRRSFEDGGAIFFGGMGSHTELAVHDFDPSGAYADAHSHPLPAFSSTAFADEAIGFLEAHDGARPFFLHVCFTAPHDPRTPPAEFRARYDAELLTPLPPFLPEHPFDNGELRVRDELLAPHPRTPELVRAHLADYYAMVSQLDHEVGRILDALERTGRAADTLVVFASDHGLAIGSHGLLGKQNLYEHSTRAPLLLRGPGIPAGERRAALAYLFDLYPTLCELAGLEAPSTVEGQSLVPALRGERDAARERVFGVYRDVQRAVGDGRWKWIEYPQIGRAQLFDLARDPHETRDLSDDPEHAEEVARMARLLRAEQRTWDDPLALPAPR